MTNTYLGHTQIPGNADLDAIIALANSGNANLAVPGGGRQVTTLATYLQNNLRVNVKDFIAPADPAGSHQPAIDRAYAAIRGLSPVGGVLYFPDSVAWIGCVSAYASNVWVVGDGIDRTIIKQPATSQRTVADASMTIGTNVVGSATANFGAADVGKTIFVGGAGSVGGDGLCAKIASVSSTIACAVIGLDNQAVTAAATVTGQACRIGTFRNVIEFNRTYAGNYASSMAGGGVCDLTIDGNRANVPAPANSGDDLGGHGVIATKTTDLVIANVKAINCHNSGVALVILTNRHRVSNLTTSNCGNATTGFNGFDVNSSSYGSCLGHTSELDYGGMRYLDNCFQNEYVGCARRPTNSGGIFNNQIGNASVGNQWRLTVEESIGTGVQVGGGCRGNQFDLTVSYSGCTRTGPNTWTVQAGVLGIAVGGITLSDANNARGNTLRITAFRNGGVGAQSFGLRNSFDLSISENSQASALSNYGFEQNGSYNLHRGVFDDPTAFQRGIVIRDPGGMTGTAATANVFVGVVGSPTSPLDDQGLGTMYFGVTEPINGGGKRVTYGAAVPTTGKWNLGDLVLFDGSLGVSRGTRWGWVCTATGTPGTWMETGRVGDPATAIPDTAVTTSSPNAAGAGYVQADAASWVTAIGNLNADVASLLAEVNKLKANERAWRFIL